VPLITRRARYELEFVESMNQQLPVPSLHVLAPVGDLGPALLWPCVLVRGELSSNTPPTLAQATKSGCDLSSTALT